MLDLWICKTRKKKHVIWEAELSKRRAAQFWDAVGVSMVTISRPHEAKGFSDFLLNPPFWHDGRQDVCRALKISPHAGSLASFRRFRKSCLSDATDSYPGDAFFDFRP